QQGWTVCDRIAISPKLTAKDDVPCGEWDEWYVVAEPSFRHVSVEVFVNYGCFTLASPQFSAQDSLVEQQERFWRQLERIAPVTFVAMGDNDIVVSRLPEFINAIRDEVQR